MPIIFAPSLKLFAGKNDGGQNLFMGPLSEIRFEGAKTFSTEENDEA